MSQYRKEYGKIKHVNMGYGGYQDAQFGFRFTLGGQVWGVQDFWGCWGHLPSETAKWTHESQIQMLGNTVWRIKELMDDAKAQDLTGLINAPIVAYFDVNLLKEWEIFKEVI